MLGDAEKVGNTAVARHMEESQHHRRLAHSR